MVNNSKGWGLIGINEVLTPIKIKNKSDELELKYLGTKDIIKSGGSDYKWLQRNNPELFKLIIDDRYNKYLSLGKSINSKSKSQDTIINDAKKHNDYTKFTKTKTYRQAIRVGPCYDEGGNKVNCYYWESPNQSKTNGDTKGKWVKNPNNKKNSYEFLDSITSHMTRSEFGPKMVYSYTFFDDENKVVGVYVGITNDEERRKEEHLTGKTRFTDKEVNTAVGNFIKENPTFKAEYTKLTEYAPFVEAQVKEKEYVDNAKSNGYNILNIAKTGAGGANFGFPDKYLIDKVNDWIKNKKNKKEEALLKDFTSDYKNTIYDNIIRRYNKGNVKLYNDTLGKLIRSSKTEKEIIEKAMSCNSFSEFRKKYKNYYNQAQPKKILPQIKQMFKDGLNTPDQTTPETTPSV